VIAVDVAVKLVPVTVSVNAGAAEAAKSMLPE
jgi:hypothetical protein